MNIVRRLLLRIPEPWARRWGMRWSVALALVPIPYWCAWTWLGWRDYAHAHFGFALTLWLSVAWLPLVFGQMFFQSVLFLHFMRQSRASLTELEELQEEVQGHAANMLELMARVRGEAPDLPETPKVH